jgi:hypothetical protein
MAKFTYTRDAIGSLAERLEARSTSALFQDRPELQSDLRAAAAVIRFALAHGVPVSPIEIDTGGNGGS